MNLTHLDLSQLTLTSVNMRAKRKDRDIADLLPSVRARGVLVPILVRPNGEPDMYEIIAGRRRFFAAKAVGEETGSPVILPCAVMAPGDDAAALEASLLENVARLDADEVTQWETFSRLVKLGRSVDDIAATFGLDDKVVRRVLALGNLLPRVRGLYRDDKIDTATVRHLTMATSAQQRDWLTLYDDPENHAPTGRVLKEWLFGGSAIPTTAALFDPAAYKAPIVGDLFAMERYFSDSALFWTFQRKAIEERRQGYLAQGWSHVMLLDEGHWFDRWAYEKRSQAKGGHVYIVVGEHGGVEFHEGYLPRKEAQRRDQIEEGRPAPARSELSSPLRRYVELHQHALVRARLVNEPWIALKLMLAHAIAGSGLWAVRCEWQRANKPDTQDSVKNSPPERRFGTRRSAMLGRLGLHDNASSIVEYPGTSSLSAMFEAVSRLDQDGLLELVALVVGESLEAGSEIVGHIGTLLAIDAGEGWAADEAFFSLLRDRKVLRTLLEDVAGPETARANADAPAKVLKAILGDCLEGRNGRAKVEHWAPRWMRFPVGMYLEEPAPPDDVAQPPHAEAAE